VAPACRTRRRGGGARGGRHRRAHTGTRVLETLCHPVATRAALVAAASLVSPRGDDDVGDADLAEKVKSQPFHGSG
jgi:hypothetical protein